MQVNINKLVEAAKQQQICEDHIGLNQTLTMIASQDQSNAKNWANLAKSYSILGQDDRAFGTLSLFLEKNLACANHKIVYETALDLAANAKNDQLALAWFSNALSTGLTTIALSAINALSLSCIVTHSDDLVVYFEKYGINDGKILFRMLSRLTDSNQTAAAHRLIKLIPSSEQNSNQAIEAKIRLLGTEGSLSDMLINAEFLESSALSDLNADDQFKVIDQCARLWHKFSQNDRSLEAFQRSLEITKDAKESSRIYFFVSHYSDGQTPETLRNKAKRFQSSFSLNVSQRRPLAKSISPKKIGFISCNFQAHPVGWMTAGFFCEAKKLHDKIHTVIFDTTPRKDFVAKTIKEAAGDYLDVSSKNDDEELAEYINHQNIDILVDLDGCSLNNRIESVIYQRAPVVKWVGGLIGSTYLRGIDYLITDRHQTPDHLDADYSEALIKMTDTYVTYTPPPFHLAVLEPPHTVNGFITFGCFNNASKLSARCLRLWSEILNKVPGSKLLLKDGAFSEFYAREYILNEFSKLGIESSRITIKGHSSHDKHIATIRHTDICLDPMPYSGGLSTIEAAYVGVPVVTLPGRLLAHRHAASHLHSLNATELIAQNESDYVDIAVELATNKTRILDYRTHLRNSLYGGPLLNHQGFTEEFIKKMAAIG